MDARIRIVVTGRHGQVARALAQHYRGDADFEVIHIARPDADFSRPGTIAETVARSQPHIVVNAAAYTAVDRAESEPELATMINAVAAGEVARGAAVAGAFLIQISTDYVFDGTLGRAYREDDVAAPICVYGATKLAGEKAVSETGCHSIILRTSWIYSPFGNNFVKTMLRLSETRRELRVVADQVGCPTSAFVIARGVDAIARKLERTGPADLTGIYHLCGTGDTSWHGFAEAIFECVPGSGTGKPDIVALATKDYPTAARRPADTRLDTSLFKDMFGYAAPDWRSSLQETLSQLGV